MIIKGIEVRDKVYDLLKDDIEEKLILATTLTLQGIEKCNIERSQTFMVRAELTQSGRAEPVAIFLH